MNNTYEHIHPDFLHLLELDKKAKCYAINEAFVISYPKAKELLQIMSNYMNKPKKHRMQNLLIIAEPNMGKTTIAKKFHEMYPDIQIELNDEIKTIKPIIYVDIQNSDEKEFYVKILDQFWAPYRITHSKLKLKQQAIHLLKLSQVKTIIFDEIHNILTGSPLKQKIIMDTIKNLSNELKIPIIGVGTKAAATILYSDPQHVSRFDIIKIDRWELDNDFRGLLKSFEKRIPLKKPSNLPSKEKATLLYDMCQGNLGHLHKILIACAEYAILNDIEEITLDIIKKFIYLKEAKVSNPKSYANR